MIIDTLQNSDLYTNVHPKFKQAFDFLKNTNLDELSTGKHEIDGELIFAIINKYETNTPEIVKLEAHKKYIDLQYVHHGNETLGFTSYTKQSPSQDYVESDDFQLFEEDFDSISFKKGMFSILYPDDIHAPGLQLGNKENVVKVVIKIQL